MKKSWIMRAVTYFGIGLILLFTVRISEIILEKNQDRFLPSAGIDEVTEDHLENGRWDSALDDLIPLFEDTNDTNLKTRIALCFREMAISAFLEQQYGEAAAMSESGLSYVTDDPDLYYVLGVARLAQSKYEAAEDAFTTALALNPENADVYKKLGEIYYLRNEMERAEAAWSEAYSLDPEDTDFNKRLIALRKQLRLDKTLDTDDSLYFTVSYDGEKMPGIENTVLNHLESAYYDIGGKLQIYPKRKISVTLLTREAFIDITGTPDWTAGLYEGQIKIPVAGVDSARLRTILYHEYTHAVLFDQIGNRFPWWLNEGLAQYLSEKRDEKPENGYSAREMNQMLEDVTLSDLGGVFNLDEDKAAQSYSMALSGVRYFITSFGEAAIQKIIMSITEGDSFEAAFYSATGFSFDQFEDDWRKDGNY